MRLPYSLLSTRYIGLAQSYLLCNKCSIITSSQTANCSSTRLAVVGKFDVPKLSGKYDTGQLFLHRVFGYRGVILFPWIAKVYDRDGPGNTMSPESEDADISSPGETLDGGMNRESLDPLPSKPTINTDNLDNSSSNKNKDQFANKYSTENSSPQQDSSYINQLTKDNVKGCTHTYYQVLIDARDCQYLKLTKKAQTEAVTFLGNKDNGRTLYAVPGLDYVGHEDVMPYSSALGNGKAIHHELFQKFLQKEPGQDPPYSARDTLKQWQERNHPWLELSDVHKETTQDIRVTVIPFYMGCREGNTPQSNDVYWWRYCIRLENLGELQVQLRERHWRIFSLSGTLETVRGRGVVGCEPVMTRTDPAFQYSSHVSLQSPSGHMWGTFRMEREDGLMFECRIPPFSLESKGEDSEDPPHERV